MKPLSGALAPRLAVAPLLVLAVVVAAAPWTVPGPSVGPWVLAAATAIATGVAWSYGLRRAATYAAVSLVAFLVSAAVDQSTGASPLRELAVCCTPLIAPLAAGALGARGIALRAALVAGLVTGLGRVLLYDPFRNPGCVDCRPNALAVAHVPALADAITAFGTLGVVTGLVVASRGASRPWSILGLAIAAGLSASSPAWSFGAIGILCASLTVEVARTLLARSRLRQSVETLREGDLGNTLRSRLHDPDLTVAFWLPDEHRFGTSEGGHPEPAGADQITTEIRSGDTMLVAVHHAAGSVDVTYLAEVLDGPARLALANQCLSAQLASHERALRASRRRLIDQWDVDRRRMERDIHDSAQHLALSLGLEVQHEAAKPGLDPACRDDLTRCLALVKQALDQLREVSHGLYPPSLESRGLAPALTTLAMYSDGNLTIGKVPGQRLPAAVERTVIALVADIAADGSPLNVDAELDDGVVRITLNGAAHQPTGVVLDRIDVLDGSVDRLDGGLTAVIPCA